MSFYFFFLQSENISIKSHNCCYLTCSTYRTIPCGATGVINPPSINSCHKKQDRDLSYCRHWATTSICPTQAFELAACIDTWHQIYANLLGISQQSSCLSVTAGRESTTAVGDHFWVMNDRGNGLKRYLVSEDFCDCFYRRWVLRKIRISRGRSCDNLSVFTSDVKTKLFSQIGLSRQL